jgi:phosphoglycolate phosphatase-like HAD superfamily hydrolase
MRLAIFDVDGTLTETNEVDNKCFIKAFADSHQIFDIETDWKKYNHVTDSGISLEIFNKRLGRSPDEQDFFTFKNCFIKRLSEFAVKDETLFGEIKNAKKMLEQLKLEKGWAIALATGSYYDSARLKLEKAKINFVDVPIATADDAVSREEILQIAIKKSLEIHRQTKFEKIVSIGDGVWDVRTAKNLNLSFIGVASGKQAELLRVEGANCIIKDFSEYEVFLKYLND